MNNIKTRTINGKLTFYTADDGQTLSNINSVSFQDVPNSVFTIVKKDKELYVHLPQKNMSIVRLEEAINKYNLIIFKVS
jgi:hypothetical protein